MESRKPKRILLFYLKTGGGHISGARALAGYINREYDPQEVEAIPVDGVPPGSKSRRALLETGYRMVGSRYAWLWPIVYELSRIPLMQGIQSRILARWLRGHIAQQIQEHEATKLVVLHFLLVEPVTQALRMLGREIPVVTVVMDPFSVHSFWFRRREVPLIVFSELARDYAMRKYRIPGQNIYTMPVVLREEFNAPLGEAARADVRRQLEIPRDAPVTLFAGGGDGIPHAERYLEEALRAELPGTLIVVCGNNHELAEKCRETAADYPGVGTRLRIHGFVNNMYELMNIADVVVSKAGPASIMEILMLRKPLIIVQYMYGQEKGNVDFVTQSGVGSYIRSPRKAIARIQQLLNDPQEMEEIHARIDRLGLENGTAAVARHLVEI